MILFWLTKPVRTPIFNPLLLVLLSLVVTTTGSSGSLLALDTARAATTVGGGKGEVDVLLGVQADHVGGDVDDLLADTILKVSNLASLCEGVIGCAYRM